MELDTEDPVMKFFRIPDLVEKILPYLDVASTLHLARAKISCTIKILEQNTSEWDKLMKRTLPGTFKIEVYPDNPIEYWAMVNERFYLSCTEEGRNRQLPPTNKHCVIPIFSNKVKQGF